MKHADREVAARQTGASLSWALEIRLTPASHSPASRAPGAWSTPLNPLFLTIFCMCTQTWLYWGWVVKEGEEVHISEMIWPQHRPAKSKEKQREAARLSAASSGSIRPQLWAGGVRKSLKQRTMIHLRNRHPSLGNLITEQFGTSMTYQLFDLFLRHISIFGWVCRWWWLYDWYITTWSQSRRRWAKIFSSQSKQSMR